MTTESTYNNIPTLRFPDFANDGEWEVKRLGEIVERITIKVGDLELRPVSISAGIGFVDQKNKFGRDISGSQYANYIVLRKGEFAYNKGNSLKYPQGCVYQLREFDVVACPNVFICFRVIDDCVDRDYLSAYFSNNYHGNQLQQYITSGVRSNGLLNISAEDFFSIKIPIPPFAEQQRIAACLTALNEMITATNGKLEQLKAYKKGLMQNLFVSSMGGGKLLIINALKKPKLRFPKFYNEKEWEEKKLGEILLECKEVSKTENEDILLSSTIDGIFLNSEIFSHQRGSSSIGYRKLRRNMLILSAQNLHLGNANVNLKYEHGLISPAYKIYDIINCIPEFLYHWIKRDSTKAFFFDATIEGASVCRRNVVWDKLYNQSLFIPSQNEQRKIVSCLSTMDDQINAYTKKVALLKQYKKGLMQQMFPQNQVN